MNWISVNDETPPADIPILVWTNKSIESRSSHDIDIQVWIVIWNGSDTYYIEHDGDGGHLGWYDVTVTHWAHIVGPNGEVQIGTQDD